MKVRARVTLMMSSTKIRARLLFRGCTVVVASHTTDDQFFLARSPLRRCPKESRYLIGGRRRRRRRRERFVSSDGEGNDHNTLNTYSATNRSNLRNESRPKSRQPNHVPA
jgi:hypothetical protein